jgi:hypothetical protein
VILIYRMKDLLKLILPVILLAGSTKAQDTGAGVLKRMHERHYQALCRSYTFSQNNTHYRNDSVIGKSVWHEAVLFPDRFLIRFGDPGKGNYVLFRNDSVYNYRKSELIKSRRDTNTLLLLLGGMYYRDFADVKERLEKSGYDLSVVSDQTWKGSDVYVIGAKKGDYARNQIWIDKKELRIFRIIEKMNETDWMDMSFDGHQKMCNGFVENKVSFRRNGILEQVEEYFDLKEAPWPGDN